MDEYVVASTGAYAGPEPVVVRVADRVKSGSALARIGGLFDGPYGQLRDGSAE